MTKRIILKNDLVDMLREAFEAGMSCAAAYEHGTYAVDFRKWHEENKNEIEQLHNLFQEEIECLTYDVFHLNQELETLYKWIKSDSVYTLLRYGSKSPCNSGVDDCEDDLYYDLYNLSTDLRKKELEENEVRKDDFDQRLP